MRNIRLSGIVTQTYSGTPNSIPWSCYSVIDLLINPRCNIGIIPVKPASPICPFRPHPPTAATAAPIHYTMTVNNGSPLSTTLATHTERAADRLSSNTDRRESRWIGKKGKPSVVERFGSSTLTPGSPLCPKTWKNGDAGMSCSKC